MLLAPVCCQKDLVFDLTIRFKSPALERSEWIRLARVDQFIVQMNIIVKDGTVKSVKRKKADPETRWQ
jgi:hypothetical protein